ncbi:MAG: tripartite tricarboxylate transporter substrate-binding protein [Lautropia sp.]
MARLLASRLTEKRGWTTVVENRAGAGGAIGAALVANSPPDGYSLLVVSTSHTMIGAIQKLPYDPVKSFTPIAIIGTGPNVITIRSALPVNSIAELIAYAKERPGKLTYASAGVGSNPHFVGELFKLAANIDVLHVPYKGGSPAINDLLAGQVDIYWGGLATVLPLIKAGKMKALGVSTRERSQAAPEIPIIADTLPGFEASIWYAVLAAPNVPAAIVAKLNTEITSVMRDPETVKQVEAAGVDATTSSSAAAAKVIADNATKWMAIAKSANIRME